MIRRPRARLTAALPLLLAVPAARAAVVSGRVLDSGGTPVAGVSVVSETYRTDERTRVDETKGVTPSPLGETKTDADGRFRVTIEKPGVEVSIRVVPGALPGALLEGPFDSSEDVALDDLELPAVEKVSGRITDEARKPIAGAKLRTVSGFGSEEDVRFYAEATTDVDGSFSIPNAPIGGGGLNARAPGYAPFARSGFQRRAVANVTLKSGGTIQGTVLDPSGKPAEGAIVVCGLLAAQTDASGMFRLAGLPPGAQTVEALWKDDLAAQKDTVRIKKGETAEVSLRLVRAAAVAGTVVDEKTRRPLPGVRVSVSTGASFFRGEVSSRRARTDAKGRFRVAGLLPRRYTVRAAKSEYLPVSMPGVVTTLSAPGTVSIALQKAAGLSGRVTDEGGAPVAGARVRFARDTGIRALMRGGPSAFLGRPGVATGPDGTFRLRGLSAEKNLTLEASKTGYVTARRHGVTLKTGEFVKEVALVLKRGLEARGRVADSAGKPVAGAEIRFSRPEGPGRFLIQMAGADREKPDASTATDGTFRVAGLEAGEYALLVSREGYASKRVPSLTVHAEKPNDWPPIVLQAGVAVAGFVRNSKGEPVVGAQILSFGEGSGPREGASDPEGRFRLEGFSPDRSVMMSIRADGYAPLQRGVTPPAEDLSLVLKTSGTIRGRVEDASTKRPATDFTVSYREPSGGGFPGMRIMIGGPGEKAFQSPEGAFELTDVPPGKWSVTASSPGYRPAEVTGIEIGEGETKEGIVLSLKKGGVVIGRVLDPRRGTGVANAGVAWRAESPGSGMGGPGAAALARLEGGGERTQTTDADGRFRFEGLPQGKLTLDAEHPDFLGVSKEVELEDEANVELTLSLGGTIAGSVVGKDGRTPAPGAQVSLDEQGSTFNVGSDSVRADASGNFLFEHLKAGRYRVSARSNAGSSTPKDVVLAESQRVDGVLLEMATGAMVRGTVSGLPAERLDGLRVWASGKEYQDSTITGDDGKFTLRDVPAGVLQVSASTSFPSRRSASKNVEVPEGAAEVPVEIVFEGTSRLAGRVTRSERPLSGVFVAAVPDPPAAGMMRGTAQTDENGQYVLEGLADGDYQVTLSGQGVSYRRAFTVSGETAGDIALPAMSISGVVTESGSSELLEGASVQAEIGGGTSGLAMKRAVTDSRGYYSIDDIDSGSYQVTARKDGYQLKTQPVSVVSSSVELNLSLARGAGLAIRAFDGLTGLPLRGLIVLADSDGGVVAFSGTVSLDNEGKGEISSLAPGRYSLHVFSDGYAARSFPAVVVPSPTLGVPLTPGGRVEIRTDTSVTGRLIDSAGSPYLFFPSRRDSRVSVPAPIAAWEHIAPGSYQLIVSSASGEKTYPFNVVEGGTTIVEIR